MKHIGPYLVESEYLVEAAARKWWDASPLKDKLAALIAAKVLKPHAEKVANGLNWAELSRKDKKDVVQGLRNLGWAPQKKRLFKS